MQWLAQTLPDILEYLLTANIYMIGEAPLEAPSRREVTFEPESAKIQPRRETEETEQLQYTLTEEEDLEAATIAAENQKYNFQQPPAGQFPHRLKKSLNKGQQQEVQYYTERMGDRNQTLTKASSRKQTQMQNLSKNLHKIGWSRTDGYKEAGRTKRLSDDDSDDDLSILGSDAGRDADRCGSDDEPDKKTAAEQSDRSVGEITHSMPELEKITGQKRRSTSAKTNKPNKLAKIRDRENFKAEKYRDTITFDQYGQLINKWLKWQEYHIQSEDALETAGLLMTGSAVGWLNNFVNTTRRKNRNIHSFLCFLRYKLIPKIRQDVLWKQYLHYHHAQLGINVPINEYARERKQYRIRSLEKEYKPMTSNHVVKVKFLNGLLPWIRDKVIPMVD